METTLKTIDPGTTLPQLIAQPILFFENIKCATLKEAILSNSLSLVTLKKATEEVVAKAILVKIVGGVIKYFNVGKSMTDAQVAEVVGFILSDYYFLKLTDLKVWSDGIKKGRYLGFSNGKLFDRLDGQILMLSLNEYCEERTQTAITIQTEKQGEQKALDAGGEKYIIQAGEYFIRANGDEYEEIDRRELATGFEYVTAAKIKKWLVVNHYRDMPNKVMIVSQKKAMEGFFEYLKRERPDLIPVDKPAFNKARAYEYDLRREQIMNDTGLTELQKANKIRAMVGLMPLNAEEFKIRQELEKKTKRA